MNEVPDYTTRIAGARSWRVANTLWARMGGLLWAHSMLEPWRPVGEEYVAACPRRGFPHEVPGEHCDCGIWAWYSPEQLTGRWFSPDARHTSGIVSGAGVMWLHEFGWRAERVRVEALFLDDVPEEVLPTTKAEIASAYKIPIIDPGDFGDFCKDRGLVLNP